MKTQDEKIRVVPYAEKWFARYQRTVEQQVIKGDTKAQVDVPCAGCQSCCHIDKIEINLDLDRPNIPFLDTEVLDGELQLKHREDGACIHLGPDGCMVYEHRPAVCRTFDCRLFSAFGVRFDYSGHTTPDWKFLGNTQGDRNLLSAMRNGLMIYQQINPDAPGHIAIINVLKMLPMILQTIELIDKMPDDMKEQASYELTRRVAQISR